MLRTRDVQEELEHDHTIFDQHVLERVNLIISLLPHMPRDEIVYTCGDDIFIVRPIEDADHAVGRNDLVYTPEKVVPQLKRRRLFEARDVTPLWVARAKYRADRPIFSRGVTTL